MPDIPTSAQGPQLAVESKNVWQRLLGFIEQPLFLTPVGIVAGIVGVFIYIPVLCICGGCVLLAFHRAKVVTGCPVIKVQVPSYLLLFVVTFATLSSAQVYVSRKMKDANISIPAIVNQIISGVVSGISKFAPQSNLASPGTAAPSTPSAPPQIIRAYIDVRLYDKGYPVTPYWLVVPTGQCSMYPIKAVLDVTIINNKPVRTMVSAYTIKVRGKRSNQWDQLIRLEPRNGFVALAYLRSVPGKPQIGRTIGIPSFTSIQTGVSLNDLDFTQSAVLQGETLNGVLDSHYLQPGDSVSGWAFFDYANEWDVAEDLQINVTDEFGRTYSSVSVYGKNVNTAAGGLTSHLLHVATVTDLSNCAIKKNE